MLRCCLLLLTVCAVPASAAEPVFETQNIFPPGDKHAHSSSIVECPDGGFLACWFYGSGERKAADVVVQGSRLQAGAKQWSPIFQMADTPGFPDCNPVLHIDSDNRLWMYWICVLAEGWQHSVLKYRRADTANGTGVPDWSWQDVIQLKPGPSFPKDLNAAFEALKVPEGMWAEYALPYSRMLVEAAHDPIKRQTGWMSRIHPIVLPSGRIILPVYHDGFNISMMAISDDKGETWHASAPLVGLAPIQPAVVRRNDGTLVAYCRDSGGFPGRVLISESKDDGETWSPAVDTDLKNPGSSLSVRRLQDGRWLYVGNDLELKRNRLTVMLSSDEGRTWPVRRVVEPSDKGGHQFDYPTVIQSRDGLIHLSYSYTSNKGRCIRHTVLNTEWIEAGARQAAK